MGRLHRTKRRTVLNLERALQVVLVLVGLFYCFWGSVC